MYRPSVEKNSPDLETALKLPPIKDNVNLAVSAPSGKSTVAILLARKEDRFNSRFNALLTIILRGNFRALLLPTFSRMIADQPSETAAEAFSLLHRLFDFQGYCLPHAESWNKNFKFPSLDLSSCGFSDSFLSNLIKQLREHYCNPPQTLKGLASQPAGTGAFLQHIDLSNNQLKPTRRGARQIVPSVGQRLAVWLSHPRCRLQSLNLSHNSALGGSGETFAIGWESDIYRIIQGLKRNTSLEVLKLVNTGINRVDFEALANLLWENGTLRVVDLTNNPITSDGRLHLNTMLEHRYKNNHLALSLELEKTGLLEPVAIHGPRSSERSKTKPVDPLKVLGKNNPLDAFILELSLQMKYLTLRTVGHQIFAEHKPEHYPDELEYYKKLLHIIILVLGGAVSVISPLAALTGALINAIGFVGFAHKAKELIQGLKDLFTNITPEEEKLFSFENLHLLYEALKDGIKTGKKSKEEIHKIIELGKKLKSSSPSAKDALDKLHSCFQGIAKLFINNKILRTKIVMAFTHDYYDIILRLNTEEAVRFAKSIGSTIESGLLGLALLGDISADEVPDRLLKHFQLMQLNIFQTLRFTNIMHQGYVLQPEKSFKDIFGISRVGAWKKIIEHPRQEDFNGIMVSLSKLLVNRTRDRYFFPALPVYLVNLISCDAYDSLRSSLSKEDFTFTLTELLSFFRDPGKMSAKRRQLAELFFRLQTGEEDECCWHPALLQALARVQGFTLKIWEYHSKRSLVPHFEDSCASYEHPACTTRIDCVDKTEVEKDSLQAATTVAIKFSQIRLEGYDTEPTQSVLPIPELRTDQIKENESSVVWIRDLLQRSGWACAGNVQFDISKRLQSQAGKIWTQTDRTKLGCVQVNQATLDIVNGMVKEYQEQICRTSFSIIYNNHCYHFSSLTPNMPMIATLLGLFATEDKENLSQSTPVIKKPIEVKDELSKLLQNVADDSITMNALIKPLLEAELFAESPTFPYFMEKGSVTLTIRALRSAYMDYVRAKQNPWSWTRSYAQTLRSFADFQEIQLRFMYYAITRGEPNSGWIHINVLRAIATVQNIHLEFYQLDESGEMSPHPRYTNVCPAAPQKTVRLLYLDTHRYVPLSNPVALEYIPLEPFKWTCDNALVSRCGLYKLSVSTLKELAKVGELKPIESVFVVEEFSKRLDDLYKKVEDHEVRITALEARVEAQAETIAQLVEEAKNNAEKAVEAENRVKAAEDKAREAIETANNALSEVDRANKTNKKLQDELMQAMRQNAEQKERTDKLEARLNRLDPEQDLDGHQPNNNNNVPRGGADQNNEPGLQAAPNDEAQAQVPQGADGLNEDNPDDTPSQDNQNPSSPRGM